MTWDPAAPAPPYPATRQGDVVDHYHGEGVADPYRWLEDAGSAEVTAWIDAQNGLTQRYLADVADREAIRARLTGRWNYPKVGVPFEQGGRWFQTRNSGLQNQPVLFVMDAPDGRGRRPLLDANALSADGTVAVSSMEVSRDGGNLAYATSVAGSDWQTWRVRDVTTGVDLDDVVEWSKFSTAAWRHDGSGFYYVAGRPPAPGGEGQEQTRPDRVMLHRLATGQDDDELILSTADHPDWLPGAEVSADGRYLVISIRRGLDPETLVEVLDLDNPASGLRPLVADFAAEAMVVGNDGPTFFVLTDHLAGRRRIVAVDLDHPDLERWQPVVAETGDNLVAAHLYGGRLVCHYLHDAHSRLRVHALDGTHLRDIPLPGLVSVAPGPGDERGVRGDAGKDLLHFRTTSFTDSGAVWAHDLHTGATECVEHSAAAVDSDAFVTEQVFATSEDGTRVPMFLTRRRDLAPTGEVPVLLYGYGGFDIPVTPSFSVAHLVWMERGGMLAVASLRGGGEYGRTWYEAGRLAHKQKVFDDFCACARWLTASGWSRPERTAITGGSNGGLLVGACLTQHPELFGAVAAQVGVFDMLRFPLFTIGWAWTTDFGNPDDPEQYRWLRAYSPLHNVHRAGRYPPVLLMTGDHDDRVVPAHSLKFAATLQEAHGQDSPMLLRVETSTGHGLGKPTAKLIAESTDYLAFLDAALSRGFSGHAARLRTTIQTTAEAPSP